MLGSPTQFYIVINYYFTILRTYQTSNEGRYLDYYISDDVQFQGLKGISNQKLKYFAVQNVVIRSYRLRVITFFLQEIIDSGLLDYASIPSYTSYIDTVKAAVLRLLKDQYLILLDIVYQKAFINKAQRGKNNEGRPTGNNSYTTICRFLKEVEQFITVRRAVRQINIGYLRRAVNYLILPFLGASQLNYSRKIAYLRQLLSLATNAVLQRAILITSVISKGKYGKAVAADEELELYNLDYSKDIS